MCRFLHPIIYGEYPKSMQAIVKDRLPKFSSNEIKMVKGSIDYVGINQYTSYYIYDPHQPQNKMPTSYQLDWNAGFACKMFYFYYGYILYFTFFFVCALKLLPYLQPGQYIQLHHQQNIFRYQLYQNFLIESS